MAIVYISHFIEEVKSGVGSLSSSCATAGTPAMASPPTSAADIVGMMVGRTLDDMYPRGARSIGEPMLELDRIVPGSATLTLHRGEILGIAGLLGSGRTRLLRAIFGLEPVTSGAIVVGAYSGLRRRTIDGVREWGC
jgi:ABC-type sugar transport system, ATPase component